MGDGNDSSAGVKQEDLLTCDISSSKEPPPGTTTLHRTSKHVYLLSGCLYMCFICLGLVESLTGPTLVHLAQLLDTDIAGISLRFTAGSIGYLVGSLLCGVIFDKYNYELQFSGCICILGMSTTLLPWLPNRPLFFACDFVVNLSCAFLDAACQPYIIGLWTNRKYKEPIVQGMHGVYTVGAVLGPFIASPFLVDLQNNVVKSSDKFSSNMLDTSNQVQDSDMWFNSTSYLDDNLESLHVTNHTNGSTTEHRLIHVNDVKRFPETEPVEQVRFCYAIIGAVVLATALVFVVAFFIVKSPLKQQCHKKSKRGHNNTKNNTTFKLTLLVLQFFFVMFYYWCEEIPANLLSAYAIVGLDWEVSRATLLMSVFWTCHGVGVLFGILISAFTSPKNMLAFNLLNTTAAFVLLLLVPYTADWLLWIAASLNAFATATTFASALLWMSKFTKITGKIGSVFMCGISCGSITGSTVAAYLFECYSHEWVAYLCLTAAIIDCVLFVIMCIITQYHKDSVATEESTHLSIEDTKI